MNKRIWLSRLSATTQLLLGFTFGMALVVGAAAGAGYFYYKKMSTLPKKPIFYEETAEGKKAFQQAVKPPSETPAKAAVEPEAKPEPEPEPEPEPAEPELPPNAYKARVTWPQGLSLRSEPSVDAARVGGIAYNAEIIVLEVSADSRWQKVILPWNEQEGWVKNGNTERVDY